MEYKILDILANQRKEKTLCDISIELESSNEVFWGHFHIISSQSKFILELCTIEKSIFSIYEPLKIIITKFDCISCLSKIFNFFYSEEIEVEKEHAAHIADLAHALNIPALMVYFNFPEYGKDKGCVLKTVQNSVIKAGNFFTYRQTSNQDLSNRCLGCSFTSDVVNNVIRHLQICSSPTTICTLCDVGFYDKCIFKKHLIFHENEKPFFCFDCDFRYHTKSALNIHIRKHIVAATLKAKVSSKEIH